MILPRVKTAIAVNFGVIFLTELGVLASVWYCAWVNQDHYGFGATYLPAFLAASALGWLWSLLGSPKARLFKLRGAARFVFELLWFGAGVAALYAAGRPVLALVLALLCVVSKTLAFVWRGDTHTLPWTGGVQ